MSKFIFAIILCSMTSSNALDTAYLKQIANLRDQNWNWSSWTPEAKRKLWRKIQDLGVPDVTQLVASLGTTESAYDVLFAVWLSDEHPNGKEIRTIEHFATSTSAKISSEERALAFYILLDQKYGASNVSRLLNERDATLDFEVLAHLLGWCTQLNA